ncbi:MAG TPA: hypothetical protein VFY82_06915 [Acidimicrobiales bacterium]|nr:hypothetical protein [Acidimicrobiales bacterium]
MTQRLAERAARALGPKVGRRGFLTRSAMVGTALAATPANYILRPGSAYAAVCNCSGSRCDCGAQCCDGYTEFCCKLSGQNRCPPGSLTGGWWKVDASNFCGGGARYYVDCNAPCGPCGCGGSGICGGSCSGTPCFCAGGSCGNRKVGCTGFRYGQCNQHVPCLGPIVCRVVTCVPPWQTDGACGTATRVDNATRNHHRACLTGNPFGSVDAVTPTRGGVRVRGWVADPSTSASIPVHVYIDGVGRANVLANRNRPDVGRRYPGTGSAHGYDFEIRDVAPGARKVCVYGINAGEGGNVLLACRTVTVSAHPFGAVDILRVETGRLRVRGWAIDPNTDNAIRIDVYSNGRGLGSMTANRPRPDVGRKFARGDNHGFEGTFAIPHGVNDITVYAINVGAGGHVVLKRARVVFNAKPFGSLDAVQPVGGGRVRVSGWAIDPETTGPIRIDVYSNGRGRGSLTANLARSDIGRKYPAYGSNHGFSGNINVGTGQQNVCVYAINVGQGGHTLLGCRTVNAT